MANINFNTYMITSDEILLDLQVSYLKKIKNYKYKSELALQIRFTNKNDNEIISFIEKLKKEKLGIKLIINNRIDLMEKYDLDGVHFKDNDEFKNINIKKYQNNGKIFIKSTHSLKSIKEAESYNLDAITYSPIFDTPSKRKFGEPNGYELIKNNKFKIPIFALGGLNLDNIIEIKEYFYGIAAIRLFMNEDIVNNLNKRREIWR